MSKHSSTSVVERHGAVDVLVNTAGRIDAADAVRFDRIDPDAWDTLFRIDVKGTMLMCAAVVPHMRAAGGGAIVNFSGSYGNGVNQDNLVNSVAVQYCAAKGAVRAFTAALARRPRPDHPRQRHLARCHRGQLGGRLGYPPRTRRGGASDDTVAPYGQT